MAAETVVLVVVARGETRSGGAINANLTARDQMRGSENCAGENMYLVIGKLLYFPATLG